MASIEPGKVRGTADPLNQVQRNTGHRGISPQLQPQEAVREAEKAQEIRLPGLEDAQSLVGYAAELPAPPFVEKTLQIVSRLLLGISGFEKLANQFIRYSNGNDAYASGVATALTLHAMGLSPDVAQVPPHYLAIADKSQRMEGRLAANAARPDIDFRQGVFDATEAIKKAARRREFTPLDFYVECASAAKVQLMATQTRDQFLEIVIRNWGYTEKKLKSLGYVQ